MKITIDRNGDDVHIELEREPMPPERFKAVCKLAGATIGGVLLLVAIRMVGMWAVAWAVGVLVAVGLYKLIRADW